MKLKSKTVVITGANRGIGLAFAEACAREKAKLILAVRKHDRFDRSEIRPQSRNILLECAVFRPGVEQLRRIRLVDQVAEDRPLLERSSARWDRTERAPRVARPPSPWSRRHAQPRASPASPRSRHAPMRSRAPRQPARTRGKWRASTRRTHAGAPLCRSRPHRGLPRSCHHRSPSNGTTCRARWRGPRPRE